MASFSRREGGLPASSALVAVARGQAPAEVLLHHARVVNTITGEIEEASVALHSGRIAGVGDYQEGQETIDLEGRFLAPGFIDGHTHLESSFLHLPQYVRAVVPRGTTAVVTDLHELANVVGLAGVRSFLGLARRLPLEVFFMAPSCVPATTEVLGTPGARVTQLELRRARRWRQTIGLGEVMDFPGVLSGQQEVLAKVAAFSGGVVNGHAPGLSGQALNAYLAMGIGSDHESVSAAEAREKLRRGMWLMVREGSSEKNLEALLPAVNGHTYRRCLLVEDDRTCADLLLDGDLDAILCRAIRLGLDPLWAIQMVTINPATYFRLPGRGAVAPGYRADLVAFPDLRQPRPDLVFFAGRLVAREGRPLFESPSTVPQGLTDTMHVRPFTSDDLRLPARGDTFPVIEIVLNQVLTRRRDEAVSPRQGIIQADPERDLMKLVVVERHHATGNIGRGLVRGLGLGRGALASSVAHDSHNIVAAGVSDGDIMVAIKEIERCQGGLAVAAEGKVLGMLPLPIAGLLSLEPLESVAVQLGVLELRVRELGCPLASPFSTLSFLALPVIPEIRLTDKGLVDVVAGKLIA